MAFEQVKSEQARDAAELRQAVANINVWRADLPARGFGAWFRTLVLRRYANAMLKRTLSRPRRTHLDQLSPHLLRDIGLPPDVR
ncbi:MULTISPECIES: hypothetical protein [unclassified Devosia]|jgi:uncharacterized protein YjiS (DUF1127 family)|uniref:hypothetical protein n=1 Tax=unclassified Devosia TaxID=196773 RepID=UPI000869EAB1|nr:MULTISPECIES: hypothetical protein [unclassified Devosia]MBN9362704.1 hypothetical protein [Devosia sp.]ODS84763.1 MAG: hypothetical protein ABS47_18735 [Devosia sp. SCN 66-27]OJX23886.1 MAG: hypothetical protein BGO83_03250 [Devosia sp. 66-14]